MSIWIRTKFLFCVVGFEWKEWWKREADRCQLRYDRIDDWEIETRFQGCSTAPDGPPLFWRVSFYTLTGPREARHFGTKEAALAFHAEVVERGSSKGSSQENSSRREFPLP